MPFSFTCPNCGHKSQVPDQLAGTNAKCPACQEVVRIPAQDIPEVPVVSEAPAPKGKSTGKKPAAKKKSPVLLIVLLLGALGLILFCCGGSGLGIFLFFRSVPSSNAFAQSSTINWGNDFAPWTISNFNNDFARKTNPGLTPTKPKTTTLEDRRDQDLAGAPMREDDQSAAYWVKQLRDPTKSTTARNRLKKMGAAASTDLRRMLTDSNAANRQIAAEVLGEIGDLAFEAVPELSRALTDSEPAVRTAAAIALGNMGKSGRSAMPQLLNSITDTNPAVRTAVVDAIKKIGSPSKEDVAKLAVFLKDPDPRKRGAALNTLHLLKLDGETAVPMFSPLLSDSEVSIRVEAIQAIADAGAAGRPAFGKLLELADDPNADVRAAAMEALPRLGTPDATDLPRLQAGLRAKRPEVRRMCATAIGTLGEKAAIAVPFVAQVLKDQDPTVRLAALTALSKMGPSVADVTENILAVRTDADPAVRIAGLELLKPIGRKPGVFEALFGALNDADETVRSTAVKTLRALSPPPGKDDLVQFSRALKSDKADVRKFAAEELENIGPYAEPLLPAIIDGLKDMDAEVRQHLLTAIGAMGVKAKSAAPNLVQAMTAAVDSGGNADSAVQFRQAAIALGKIGQAEQGLPMLRGALKSQNDGMKKEAMDAIGSIGPAAKEMIPELCLLLENATWSGPAGEALAKMGRPAVDPLINVIDKKAKPARLAALESLGRMKPEEAKIATGDLVRIIRANKGEIAEKARAVLSGIQGTTPKK